MQAKTDPVQLVLSKLPVDRPFQWGEWDCFQLCRWVRSTVAPELPQIPDMSAMYGRHDEQWADKWLRHLTKVGHADLHIEGKSVLFSRRPSQNSIAHLDLLILSNGTRSNLGTALIDNDGKAWVVITGETAHCIPLDRLLQWSIEGWEFQLDSKNKGAG